MSGQDSQVFNHLIMVPGHGVTITESLDGADSRDADWFLLDYQKEKDVPEALVGHMRGGLDQLDADSASLLLFSGELLFFTSTFRATPCYSCGSLSVLFEAQ